jgi:hypothetical protein
MRQREQISRLLIVSCSRRKNPASKKLPAIERYDGPIFQVLRKFLREFPKDARTLDVYILSAKFGLIPSQQKIPWYDLLMDSQRATELNPKVIAAAQKILARNCYDKSFICVGKNYHLAIKGFDTIISKNLEATVAAGSSGRRQSILRNWLRGGMPLDKPTHPQGIAYLHGRKITLTPGEVIDIACRALANGEGAPCNYQSWYVPINGHRVAPKWLVSQLTGLPVGAFHSDEARRVLLQLGVKAYHS